MAKLKNTNTNNGETHNTQIKYWRNPKSSVVLTTFLNLVWEKTQNPLAKPKTKNTQWRNSKTQTQIMAKPTTHKLNTGEAQNPT
jgi:hypothetical protein